MCDFFFYAFVFNLFFVVVEYHQFIIIVVVFNKP